MCVIALSPKGNDLPTEEQIRQMFKKNSDGAGYAWDDGKTVHWRKGFMNVDDLLEDLGPLELWKDYTIAFHFRIGTAGKNDQQTTHPFPLSSSFGDLRKLRGDGPVLFHNGVLSGYGGVIDPLASDTQDFVSGVASKMLNRPNHISKIAEKTVENLIGSSRILILYGKGKYLKFGSWSEKDGNYYSNLIWEPKTYSYSSSYSSPSEYYDDEPYTYEYAWPSMWHQWLIVTPERGKLILNASEKQEDGKYKFKCTDDLIWETNDDYTEWWTTTKGKQMKLDFEEDLEQEKYTNLYDREYKYFNDDKELEEWLADKVEYNNHTVTADGQTWYVDDYTLEAFTRNIAETLTDCDPDIALEVLKQTGHMPVDEIELDNMVKEFDLDLAIIEEEMLRKEAKEYAYHA